MSEDLSGAIIDYWKGSTLSSFMPSTRIRYGRSLQSLEEENPSAEPGESLYGTLEVLGDEERLREGTGEVGVTNMQLSVVSSPLDEAPSDYMAEARQIAMEFKRHINGYRGDHFGVHIAGIRVQNFAESDASDEDTPYRWMCEVTFQVHWQTGIS